MNARLAIAIVFVAAVALPAIGQSCSTCAPGLLSNCTCGSGPLTITFDSSVDSAWRDAITSGINAWNNWFPQNGQTSPYSFTSDNNSNAAVGIYVDPSLIGSGNFAVTTPSGNGGATIRLNPEYLTSAGLIETTAMHEFGHALCFDDVWASGCTYNTAMYGVRTPSGPYWTDIGNCDAVAMSSSFPPPPPPPDPSGDQCGGFDWVSGCSPIVVNFGPGGYRLTGAEDPVSFDISAVGAPRLLGWTAPHANEAFLCLDRDHDGKITSGAEFFGTSTPLKDGGRAPNGFEALREFDDNRDGVVDERDAIWGQLLLWRDDNHDGTTQPGELSSVSVSSMAAIDLRYHWAARRDSHGNVLRYEAHVALRNANGVEEMRPIYDVFFVPVP